MNDGFDTAEVEDLGNAPDARKVQALSGYGLSPEDIATLLEIDIETLKNACSKELEAGAIKANARVAESLFRKATSGDGRESVTAAIFRLKTRARWREASARDEQEDDADPEIIFKVVYEAQPDASRDALLPKSATLSSPSREIEGEAMAPSGH